MRKILGLLMVIGLSILLTSCKDEKIQIAILQLIEHNALSDARIGFIDELAEHGYIDGKNIKININIPEADNTNAIKASNFS